MNRCVLFITVGVLASSMLTGCAGSRHQPGPRPAPDSTTSTSSTAKTNPYTVFGQQYFPLTDATGYRERGVASWYGGKFHGRNTANGERYDMYQYTAAHTTLPLPTWVKVTNLRNGATVAVRVNDRGPFVKNRLIDLSYAAALQLGMVDNGTTLVEVEAIAPATASATPSVQTALPVPLAMVASIPANTTVVENVSTTSANADFAGETGAATAVVGAMPASIPAGTVTDTPLALIYVQVGAFGELGNAERLQTSLYNAGIGEVRLNSGDLEGIPVHRVQIGPVDGVLEYDVLIAQLESIGISDTHLVTE